MLPQARYKTWRSRNNPHNIRLSSSFPAKQIRYITCKQYANLPMSAQAEHQALKCHEERQVRQNVLQRPTRPHELWRWDWIRHLTQLEFITRDTELTVTSLVPNSAWVVGLVVVLETDSLPSAMMPRCLSKALTGQWQVLYHRSAKLARVESYSRLSEIELTRTRKNTKYIMKVPERWVLVDRIGVFEVS